MYTLHTIQKLSLTPACICTYVLYRRSGREQLARDLYLGPQTSNADDLIWLDELVLPLNDNVELSDPILPDLSDDSNPDFFAEGFNPGFFVSPGILERTNKRGVYEITPSSASNEVESNKKTRTR